MNRIQELDLSVDVLRVLLWQYDNAPNIEGLLRRKQAFYDARQRDFWQNWIRDVFDLRTANDFGLSVWASILDIPLYSEGQDSPADYPAFGFATAGPNNNFSHANFATSAGSFNSLDTEQRRLLLRLRYYQLTTSATVPEINQILSALRIIPADSYVLDGQDMTLTYVFTQIPDSRFLSVLEMFDVLPRPSGVSRNILIAPFQSWGFGAFRKTFFDGNFFGN